jgi:hypothetical protein
VQLDLWTIVIFVNDRPAGHLQIRLLALLKVCCAVVDLNSRAEGGNVYNFTYRLLFYYLASSSHIHTQCTVDYQRGFSSLRIIRAWS